MAEFRNLILRISPGSDGGCEVTAEEIDSGHAGPQRLDQRVLDEPWFQAALGALRMQPEQTDNALLRAVGEGLFKVLFSSDVLALFTGLFDQRIRPNPTTCLRLNLDIDERLPDIATLPWELLRWRDTPLATQLQTWISRRFLGLDYGALRQVKLTGRPRVLLVIPGGSGLETARERDIVTEALRRTQVPFDVLEGKVTLGRLADALTGNTYHILHFIGHGAEARESDGSLTGYLRFNATAGSDENLAEEWVDHARIQALLSAQTDVRLVILNACSTAAVSGRAAGDAERGFTGLVPAILRAGVPAALAMQYPIRDDVAVQFAGTFYQRLTDGRWAGQVEAAVTLARNACFLHFPGDRGFSAPVLFLRGPEGRLFEVGYPEKEEAPMDATGLAPEVIALLLQYLKPRGEMRDRSRGAAVYGALQTVAQAHPAWGEALSDLAALPEDADAQAAARIQLKKLLARDEGLGSELARLLRTDEAALPKGGVQITAGDRSIVAGRGVNITGTVITGDIGGSVTIGKGG